MTLGVSEWLAIGGIIVGLGAIIGARRWGNRRNKLLFTWEVLQLVSQGSRARGLVVSYNDEKVSDPRLVQVTLKNLGPSDIKSEDFDSMNDLEVFVETISSDPTELFVPVREGGDIIDVLDMRTQDGEAVGRIEAFKVNAYSAMVAPRLIRRGASVTIDFLVDGPVEVSLESPLINTDVVYQKNAKRFGLLGALKLPQLGVRSR